MADKSWAVFHDNCGSSVILKDNNKRAVRDNAGTEFDNALVFSKGFLPEKTIFEVEIERKISLWSGSVALGVTSNDPNCLTEVPSNISQLKNGTWALAGCTVLQNGETICDNYSGNYEELVVGDKVGLVRLTNGELHFLINGQDMGCGVTNIPENVYVVVDVYGRCCQVRITSGQDMVQSSDDVCSRDISIPDNSLCFHELCGFRVSLANNRKTLFRPNPNEDFNNGVALTERPLAKDEMLEIKVEELIDKWAGSLEIGVTTHAPGSFQLPPTMTNVKSGTWILSGGSIVHNGITTVDGYARELLNYRVEDRLGLCVKSSNSLHFFYNGVDLGIAVSDLPDSPLYAVVDLYGQAVKVSIVNNGYVNDLTESSVVLPYKAQTVVHLAGGVENQSTIIDKKSLRFSKACGRLIELNENGTMATRTNALAEFNHAVVISEEALQDDVVFEIEVLETTSRWSGSIEIGLLSIVPPELHLPTTLTDLDHHSWLLSGATVMHDGTTIMSGYGADLDTVVVGTRVGVARKSDGTFHVYIDGQDKGTAAIMVPPGVHAAFDLYGQCVQVAIVTGEPSDTRSRSSSPSSSLIEEDQLESFHSCHGENVLFRNHGHTAVRTRNFDGGLVFTNRPLDTNKIFEIRVDKMDNTWTGSLSIGVTSSTLPTTLLPSNIGELGHGTIYLCGAFVFKDGIKIRNFAVCLDRLREGSRVGIQRRYDGSLHIYINSKHKGTAASNIYGDVHGVVDIYGATHTISIVNTTHRLHSERFLSSDEEPQQKTESNIPDVSFHNKCGLNIKMNPSWTTASRNSKFNNGMVFSRKPLIKNQMFQVHVDKFNPDWSGSLAVGVIGVNSLDKLNLSDTAVSSRLNCCVIVHGPLIYINGIKSDVNFGCNLDDLRKNDKIGVVCDEHDYLHIIVNGYDRGCIEHELPGVKYALFDLYGRCEQLSVVASNHRPKLLTTSDISAQRNGNSRENITNNHSLSPQEKTPCDYELCCRRFKKTLGLPEQYFTESITCFCDACCDGRKEKTNHSTEKEQISPIGWCKFHLRLPPKVDAEQIFSYHVAYIGVHVGSIRRTLDKGCVLPTRKTNISNTTEKNRILISPDIDRSVSLSEEKCFLFTDMISCKKWSTQLAFELRIPTTSYTQNPTTNNGWYLDTPNKAVLTGLLVKIDGNR